EPQIVAGLGPRRSRRAYDGSASRRRAYGGGEHVPVTIRLRRTGTTKRPSYRVVVADSRSPRDGRFIEVLGHYSPLTQPPTVSIDRAKVDEWIKKGAQPSNTVRKLIANAPNTTAPSPTIASAPAKK